MIGEHFTQYTVLLCQLLPHLHPYRQLLTLNLGTMVTLHFLCWTAKACKEFHIEKHM